MSSRVGLELEFMVATLRSERQAKIGNPKDSRWPGSPANHDNVNNPLWGNNSCKKAGCHALANCGLPVARMVDPNALGSDPDTQDTQHGQPDLGTSRLLKWNPERRGHGGREERFDYWFVDYDGSVTATIEDSSIKAPAGYRWYCSEINSPILSDQTELDNGLPTLRRALASIQNSIKVWLNAKCGFHVHISPLEGELAIVVAKRMAALAMLLQQPLLLSLCHPCRRKSAHARPIGTGSIIARRASDPSEADPEPGLEVDAIRKYRAQAKGISSDELRTFRTLCAILAVKDVASLAQGLRVPKDDGGPAPDAERCGLAVSNFGTVEFRYPEAAFDVGFLSLWVDLARRIFALAAAPDEQFKREAVRAVQDSDDRCAAGLDTLARRRGTVRAGGILQEADQPLQRQPQGPEQARHSAEGRVGVESRCCHLSEPGCQSWLGDFQI